MSPDYLQHIADWLQLNEPKFLQKTCATIKPIEREALEILTPQGKTLLPDKTIRLDRPESFTPPIAGAWIEKWWVDRCGQRVMRSMTVVRDRSGGLRSVALVPGESASDPLLVRDTIRIGAPAFMAALRSCTDRTSFQVIDTKVVAMRGPHDRDEDWTIAMCDQTAIIPITYSPGNATNPNGTGIIVGAGHKP